MITPNDQKILIAVADHKGYDADAEQRLSDEHPLNDCFGQLVFSREQMALILKHLIIAMSFVYGVESATFRILCSYGNQCFSFEFSYMCQVLFAFVTSWNYGVYRGWRSMNHRLTTLKHMNDLQDDQIKLRQAFVELQQKIQAQAQAQVPYSQPQPQPQQQTNVNTNVVDETNLFYVSPLSNEDGSDLSIASSALTHKNNNNNQNTFSTPFNTPSTTPPCSPKLKTATPIPIPNPNSNSQATTETKETKETKETPFQDLPVDADSLTYTPHFGIKIEKNVVPVMAESATLTLPEHLHKILSETDALSTRLAEHVKLYKDNLRQGNHESDDDDENDTNED